MPTYRDRKILTIIMIVTSLLAIFVLSGCGTSDGLDNTQSNIDLSDVAKDDMIASLVSPDIAHKGVLRVGTDASYAPSSFTGEDNVTIIGYEIDIMKAIAKILGLKIQVENAPFSSLIPGLGAKYDTAVSAFNITPEREKSVNFVEETRSGMGFVVKKNNPKNISANNLCGVSVSVQIGTAEEEALQKISADCVAAHKDPVDIKMFALQNEATTALITGRVDVMYSDSPVCSYAIAQTNDTLEFLDKPHDVTAQGIVVAKKDIHTTKAISLALQRLIDSGIYERILDAWNVQDIAITHALINPDMTMLKKQENNN